jgi:hypothetical protein
MAIFVLEAMQTGLAPVATPVGEIRTYCVHNENSILVDKDEQAVKGLFFLIECEDHYSALQTTAIAQWKNAKMYCESILDASNELVRELSDD